MNSIEAGEERRTVKTSRRGRVVALLAALLLVGVGVGWGATYAHSLTEARHYQSAKHQVAVERARTAAARQQPTAAQEETAQLQRRIQQTVGNLARPQFVLWNAPFDIKPRGFAVETVPDTFDLTARVHSRSTAVYAFFMTVDQFACWSTNACPVADTARETAHVQHGYSIHVKNFNLGEGCGGWVMIIYNQTEVPAHITGSISVTRNPAAHPTTGCL
jgi:hypothetical protein